MTMLPCSFHFSVACRGGYGTHPPATLTPTTTFRCLVVLIRISSRDLGATLGAVLCFRCQIGPCREAGRGDLRSADAGENAKYSRSVFIEMILSTRKWNESANRVHISQCFWTLDLFKPSNFDMQFTR